jgi:hypothetical protein
MGTEGGPVGPALCGGCEITRLDELYQAEAIEVGRVILEDEHLRSSYGGVLLKLTVNGVINQDQSAALIGCLKSNINNKCRGLERPTGIYAVQ